MTHTEALRLALEALEWQQHMLITAMQYSAAKGMTFLGHPPNPNEAITAIKAALEAKDEPVQVSPLQFVEMVMEKEDCIGKPIIWAEWPNKEKNT
jgi:hypothetical protein